jgi:hypothetical protein
MKKRTFIFTGILVAIMSILVLCRPSLAFAISTVTTSSAGDGVFLLQGIGIEDAAAFEIIVSYDATTLANPRVVAGPLITGAMTAINPNVPGMVRMVIVRITPVKGSGVIATMTFDRKDTSPGRVTSLSAKLATINGAPLPSLVQINNPTATSAAASETPQGQEAPAGTMTVGQTAATTGAPSIIAPAIIIAGPPSKTDEGTLKPDIQAVKQGEGQTAPNESRPEQQKESMIVARKIDDTAGVQDATSIEKIPARKIFSQKGILERFKEYRGERTARAFVSLFEREQESFIGFRQEPLVALSNGKSPVKVTFISTPGNKTSSDVAVMGARLISMKRDPENTNTWIVELQPEQGSYQASLTVFQGDVAMVYPITIAPKIDFKLARSGTMTESDLDLYLKERGAAISSKPDLNRDGKWDYRDDYILTANYLNAIRGTHH